MEKNSGLISCSSTSNFGNAQVQAYSYNNNKADAAATILWSTFEVLLDLDEWSSKEFGVESNLVTYYIQEIENDMNRYSCNSNILSEEWSNISITYTKHFITNYPTSCSACFR